MCYGPTTEKHFASESFAFSSWQSEYVNRSGARTELRLGKTERADVGSQESRNLWKTDPAIASSRGKFVAKCSKLPKILMMRQTPTFRSFRRYDEFKVHERFRYIIRLWSTKIRLDGKGATTRSVCWDTLEQVTNVAVARKWGGKKKGWRAIEKKETRRKKVPVLKLISEPCPSSRERYRFGFTFSALNVLVIKLKRNRLKPV